MLCPTSRRRLVAGYPVVGGHGLTVVVMAAESSPPPRSADAFVGHRPERAVAADRLDGRHLHAQPGHRAGRRGRVLRGALAAAADLRARRLDRLHLRAVQRQPDRRGSRHGAVPRRPGAHPADGGQHRAADAQRRAQGGGRYDVVSIGFILALWSGSRALNVFVDTITIMYGLGGHRGIVRTRALSFLLYVLGMITGVVTIPLVVAGPTLVAKWLPDSARDSSTSSTGRLSWCSASASWPRSTTCRSRCGRVGATTCRAPSSRCSAGSSGRRCCAGVLVETASGSTSIYGPLAAPIAVLLWLYLLSIAVLIGAALNAAFDQIWPQKELTSARLERLKRLKLENVLPWRTSLEGEAARRSERSAEANDPAASRTRPPSGKPRPPAGPAHADNPVRTPAGATYIAGMTGAAPRPLHDRLARRSRWAACWPGRSGSWSCSPTTARSARRTAPGCSAPSPATAPVRPSQGSG